MNPCPMAWVTEYTGPLCETPLCPQNVSGTQGLDREHTHTVVIVAVLSFVGLHTIGLPKLVFLSCPLLGLGLIFSVLILSMILLPPSQRDIEFCWLFQGFTWVKVLCVCLSVFSCIYTVHRLGLLFQALILILLSAEYLRVFVWVSVLCVCLFVCFCLSVCVGESFLCVTLSVCTLLSVVGTLPPSQSDKRFCLLLFVCLSVCVCVRRCKSVCYQCLSVCILACVRVCR